MTKTSSKNQDLTESFCQSANIKDSLLYIKNFDRFCFYDNERKYFKLFSYQDMEKEVYYFLKTNTGKNITLSICRDIVLQTKFECYKHTNNFQSIYVSLQDCLFNTITKSFEEFNIQKYSFIQIPILSTEINNFTDQLPPLFQNFINKVLVKTDLSPDPELHALIQEMFGYCLLPGTEAEASFFFVGDGANGKSKLLEILKAMVGIENCGASSIEDLTKSKFATSQLIGKRLNVCTEESSDFVKQYKFKALISGEAVDIEKKFSDGFSEVLPVKYVFATNELPNFSGFNNAFIRRLKIVPFLKTFSEKERDPYIANKIIEAELKEICLWAFKGLIRLLENKMQFSVSQSVSEKSMEFESSLSSAVAYVREQYEEVEGFGITVDELYKNYQVWCQEVGKKSMSRDRFSKEINRDLKLSVVWKPHPDTRKNSRARQLKERTSEPGAPLQEVIDELNQIIF